MTRVPPHPRRLPRCRWLALLAALGVIVGLAGLPARAARPAIERQDLPAACGGANPYFVTARFMPPIGAAQARLTPAILAFRDTAGDDGMDHLGLATVAQVGAVYGLAYDAARNRLYAAAYHKRATEFGPGGPGAVYQVDLGNGIVHLFANLPAGVDRHNQRFNDDTAALPFIGRSSLGDIDLAEDGSELFVANLFDGRVHRLSLPDGQVMGTIPNGATGLPWASSARLMALAVRDGWVYQGIMDSDGCQSRRRDSGGLRLSARARTGSGMAEVARVSMGYRPHPGLVRLVRPESVLCQPGPADLRRHRVSLGRHAGAGLPGPELGYGCRLAPIRPEWRRRRPAGAAGWRPLGGDYLARALPGQSRPGREIASAPWPPSRLWTGWPPPAW